MLKSLIYVIKEIELLPEDIVHTELYLFVLTYMKDYT